MRVRAVESHKVPVVDKDGATIMGRFVGYDPRDGTLIERGVDVPESAYYTRAVVRGALQRLPDEDASRTPPKPRAPKE